MQSSDQIYSGFRIFKNGKWIQGVVKSHHQATREYKLAEIRNQERGLMTFKEDFDKAGHFEVKIGELKPFEKTIVEMSTVGLTEIIGRKYYGVFVHHKFTLEKLQSETQDLNLVMNCPWEIEVNVHFEPLTKPPNVYILSHQIDENSKQLERKESTGYSETETKDTLTPQL